MSPGPSLTQVSGALRAWMWRNRILTVRIAAPSLALAIVVSILLLVVHAAIQGDARRLSALGVALPMPTGGQQVLVLLIVTLLLWAALTSAADFILARQMRTYLTSIDPERDSNAELDVKRHRRRIRTRTITERELLEGYLALIAGLTRLMAIGIVIALLLAGIASLGVIVTLLVAAVIGWHRFTVACGVAVRFLDVRSDVGPQPDNAAMVTAIYERDTRVQRLTVLQSLLLITMVIGAVLAPAWLAATDALDVQLVLLLVWMQTLFVAVTQAGTLGWRATRWVNASASPAGDFDDSE